MRTFLQVIDDCGLPDLDAVAAIGKLCRERIIHDIRVSVEEDESRRRRHGGVAVGRGGAVPLAGAARTRSVRRRSRAGRRRARPPDRAARSAGRRRARGARRRHARRDSPIDCRPKGRPRRRRSAAIGGDARSTASRSCRWRRCIDSAPAATAARSPEHAAGHRAPRRPRRQSRRRRSGDLRRSRRRSSRRSDGGGVPTGRAPLKTLQGSPPPCRTDVGDATAGTPVRSARSPRSGPEPAQRLGRDPRAAVVDPARKSPASEERLARLREESARRSCARRRRRRRPAARALSTSRRRSRRGRKPGARARAGRDRPVSPADRQGRSIGRGDASLPSRRRRRAGRLVAGAGDPGVVARRSRWWSSIIGAWMGLRAAAVDAGRRSRVAATAPPPAAVGGRRSCRWRDARASSAQRWRR